MKKESKKIISDFLFFDILIIALYMGNKLLGYADLMVFIRWYIMLVGSTVIGYPITSKLFKDFSNTGYVFSKILGFLIPGILVFFLCNLSIFKFSGSLCFLVFVFCLLISIFYYGYKYIRSDKKQRKDVYDKISKLFKIEVLFLVFLIIISYIKGFNPAAADVEKFMDYGFMKTLSISDYLPAKDMWLSGELINYYYFGHYIATFLSKVSQISVDYGYNLMLVSLFVITFFGSYSVASNLIRVGFNETKNKKVSIIAGIIAGLSNTVAGNVHFLIYRYIVPFVNKISNHSSQYVYYYADSTRYIGENPPTADKTIHEFPSYSFFVGDLHAHLSDLIYVVFTIALLLSYVIKYVKEKDKKEFDVKDAFSIHVIILGFLIGIMKMTNYWDFPIYLVVSLITFIFVGMRRYKSFKDVILSVLVQMLIIITISLFISLPSTLAFKMISTKIKLVSTRTVLYQFLVLWGLPLLLIAVYLIANIGEYKKNLKKENKNTTQKDKWYRKVGRAVYNYFCNISLDDLFIMILVISAIGLLIAPEIFYVVDIYDSAPRANTMFKFTYNSYIMFGFCFGYMLIKLIVNRKKIYKILGCFVLIIFMATCLYLVDPTRNVFGNIFDKSYYQGLDATKFLNSYLIGNYMNYETYGDKINYDITMQDDLAMINYLKENSNPGDVILEYYGDDFSFDNRISTFTGLQTVLGWVAHEWLWRSENSSIDFPPSLQDRVDDIYNLYTYDDVEYKKFLIEKYKIRYIIVGYMERMHVSKDDLVIPNEESLLALGEVIFKTNINALEFPSYIIEIK